MLCMHVCELWKYIIATQKSNHFKKSVSLFLFFGVIQWLISPSSICLSIYLIFWFDRFAIFSLYFSVFFLFLPTRKNPLCNNDDGLGRYKINLYTHTKTQNMSSNYTHWIWGNVKHPREIQSSHCSILPIKNN